MTPASSDRLARALSCHHACPESAKGAKPPFGPRPLFASRTVSREGTCCCISSCITPSSNSPNYSLMCQIGQPPPLAWFTLNPIAILNPRILHSLEVSMLGYGLLGTLLIICLIVWLVRRA